MIIFLKNIRTYARWFFRFLYNIVLVQRFSTEIKTDMKFPNEYSIAIGAGLKIPEPGLLLQREPSGYYTWRTSGTLSDMPPIQSDLSLECCQKFVSWINRDQMIKPATISKFILIYNYIQGWRFGCIAHKFVFRIQRTLMGAPPHGHT